MALGSSQASLAQFTFESSRNDARPNPLGLLGGSGRRSAQLRGCHPAFGLLLDAAALNAPSARSFKKGGYAGSANYRRSLPRASQWAA